MQEPKFPIPPALVVPVDAGVDAELVATTKLFPAVTVTVTTDGHGTDNEEAPIATSDMAVTAKEVEGNTEDDADTGVDDDAETGVVELDDLVRMNDKFTKS